MPVINLKVTCRNRPQRIAFVPWGHGRPRTLSCVGPWCFFALPQAWLGQGRPSCTCCVHPFTTFILAPVSQALRLNPWKAGINSGTTGPTLCFRLEGIRPGPVEGTETARGMIAPQPPRRTIPGSRGPLTPSHFINGPAWESGGAATPPAAEGTPPLHTPHCSGAAWSRPLGDIIIARRGALAAAGGYGGGVGVEGAGGARPVRPGTRGLLGGAA